MKINTNLSSLIVQSNLKTSTNGLNTAIERMTTGFKINRAKDNAANYAISTKISSKLLSYQAAQDNISMGLDMLTTATDSLELVSSHLSRIRDLAEQAANGTYGDDSLNAIQQEVNSRTAEINRIMANTEYNGISLLKPAGGFIEEINPLTESEAIAQGYTIIKTADDLQALKDNLSGKYILMNDIDLSGYNWTAIGTKTNPFSGELNGNGHVIKNLQVDDAAGNGIGLTFWRIIDGFMMQGGDPKGNGTGGADETIKGEFSSNGVKNDISHTRGTISMARSSDPDSASSQFFIVQSDSTFLDGDYAAFGHVTEGMDVVDKICKDAAPTDDNGTIESEKQPVIESITIKD